MLKHPKALLVTVHRWLSVARLAIELKHAGFAVDAICPTGHFLSLSQLADRIYPFKALSPQASIREAVELAQPDLLIPCDDLATNHLHSLHRNATAGTRSSDGSIAHLIERSLGDPLSYAIASTRSNLIELASKEGIRVPNSSILGGLGQLRSWLTTNGLPAVLKSDGSSGGVGVKFVDSIEQAERAFARLHAPPIAPRVIKRAIWDRDFNLLLPFALRQRAQVSIQSLVRGHDATMTVACWQGNLLASNCFDVLQVCEEKGPASVLRRIESPEMVMAAAKIAAVLRLSGLYGLDFVVEEQTGYPYLIEMNSRATQTCHLRLGVGHDLPSALWSAVSGEPPRETESVTERETIALFPHEWRRNPLSPHLAMAYHDVPWNEPVLIRECVRPLRTGNFFRSKPVAGIPFPSQAH
jgi:hypothetical protein